MRLTKSLSFSAHWNFEAGGFCAMKIQTDSRSYINMTSVIKLYRRHEKLNHSPLLTRIQILTIFGNISGERRSITCVELTSHPDFQPYKSVILRYITPTTTE